MSGFIEQFYYGNIEPQARGISTNKTMAKELGVLNDAEEYLTSKLSGEEKKKFLNFVNATSVVILLKDILTFAKFLNPSINTA